MKRTCSGTKLEFKTKKDESFFIQNQTTRKNINLKSDKV